MKLWYTALVSAAPILVVNGLARGQTISSTWNPLSASNLNWSTAGNWSPSVVPNNTSTQTYDVTIQNGGVILDQGAEVNSLTVDNGTLYSTQANALTIDQNLVNEAGSSSSSTIALGDGTTLLVKGNVTNSESISTYSDPGTTGHNQITVDGTLTNGGNHGLLQLGSSYAYNTQTADTLTAGTLVVGGTTSAQVQVFTGSTLNVTKELDITGGTLQIAGTVNGLGLLNQFTSGDLQLIGETITATPAFNGGSLSIGGNLQLQNGTSLTINGNVSNSGYFYPSGGNNAFTVSGAFSNSNHFELTAGDSAAFGTLTNTGSFDILKGTSVNLTNQPGGITDIGAGSELTVDGSFTTGSNAALANLQSIEGSLTLGNGEALTDTPATGTLAIGSTGSLTQNSGTLDVAGNVNNAGGSFLVAGMTTIDGQLTNGGTAQVKTGATLNLGKSITTVAQGSELDVFGTLGSAGHSGLSDLQTVNGVLGIANGQSQTIAPTSGTLNQAGAFYIGSGTSVTVQGNLNNSGPESASDNNFSDSAGLGGPGTLTVTGDLTNSGFMFGGTIKAATIENSGIVLFDQVSGIPETIAVTGAYTQTSSGSTTELLNPNDLLNASSIDVQGGSFFAAESSAKSLQVASSAYAGVQELNLGGTAIDPGTALSEKTTIASHGSLIDDGSFELYHGGSTDPLVASLSNAGSVTIGNNATFSVDQGAYQQSAGSTTVNGTLTAASVAVNGGTLEGAGTINSDVSLSGGTLEAAAPLSIIGNFSMDSNSVFAEQIPSTNTFGFLDVSGTASLAGTLDLEFANNYFPVNLQQIVILEALGGLSGTFSAIDGLNFGPGSQDSWIVSYANNEVSLTANVSATPLPASLPLFVVGLAGVGLLDWRRRRKAGAAAPKNA